MKKGNTAVHAETRSTRRESSLSPSALSAPPREKKSRRHLLAFSFPNVRFSSVAGVADPGRGTERFSERLFGWEPDTNQWFRICVLKDVASRPSVETGANVPSYSGGFAD